MRKIIVGAMVSMDGVMQAPVGPWEDPTKGFKFGGWVMPYFDQEFREELDRVFKEKFDLLLGRKTYEIFTAYWPYYDENAPHGGIAKLFNNIKKYAVSRSGEVDTSWAGSVLLRDIADVKRLKQDDGSWRATQHFRAGRGLFASASARPICLPANRERGRAIRNSPCA